MTWSERAKSAVAEIFGTHLEKVLFELGGSDPFVLLSTDDHNTYQGDDNDRRI